MYGEITIKEEIESPVESLSELMFDQFDVGNNNRKLSCSSNDSSLSSTASSTDSGYSAYSVTEKKNSLTGGQNTADSRIVQKNLELHLSTIQKENIHAILESVEKLSDTEKLLLYLKLPTRDQEQGITLSNTKQEQTQAFQWIRNNLERCDNSTNLPKHEVYEQYRLHCENQASKRYLSAPDFGKIVKCMFPDVKARRLGRRYYVVATSSSPCQQCCIDDVCLLGNRTNSPSSVPFHREKVLSKDIHVKIQACFSKCGDLIHVTFYRKKLLHKTLTSKIRYCYNGLRKKILKESPKLPEICTSTSRSPAMTTTQEVCGVVQPREENDGTDQTFAAACVVVCEWANKLLGRFFTTLVELAKFLVSGSYVSTKSMAAFTVMSATQEKIELFNKRFSLEALVKSATKQGSSGNPLSKANKDTKPTLSTTPVQTVTAGHEQASALRASQAAQVVPHTPTKDMNKNNTRKCTDQLQDKQASTAYLNDQHEMRRRSQELLLEDVNLIINDLNKNDDAQHGQQTQQQSTPKKNKKKPDPLPTQKPESSNPIFPNNPPSSAPPVGNKTPKKVGRPRIKKANSSPYPTHSPRQGVTPNMMSPRYIQNMPPPNAMHPNQNRNLNFAMPSPSPVDNELHNIFLNSRMNLMNHAPPDLQRCQSVPVPQNIPPDVYQPLTPQVQNGNNAVISPRGTTYRAKRDLSSFFCDTPMKRNDNFQMFSNKPNPNLINNGVTNQNHDRLVPTNGEQRIVPTTFQQTLNAQQNIQQCFTNSTNFSTNKNLTTTFQTPSDLGYALPHLTNNELLDIQTSFQQQVDNDELLKTLQNNENIWANEWSTATSAVPLMNS